MKQPVVGGRGTVCKRSSIYSLVGLLDDPADCNLTFTGCWTDTQVCTHTHTHRSAMASHEHAFAFNQPLRERTHTHRNSVMRAGFGHMELGFG